MPELEEISLDYFSYSGKDINLKSIKNLKIFELKANDFLMLDSPLLEEVKLNDKIFFKKQREIIEKLCSLKL